MESRPRKVIIIMKKKRRISMKARYHTLLAGAAIAAIMASGVPAMAQDTGDTAATTSTASADTWDNEIVVTAQKREQNLQDVPISMEVVSGQKLADFNASDIKSVMNYAP